MCYRASVQVKGGIEIPQYMCNTVHTQQATGKMLRTQKYACNAEVDFCIHMH